MPKTRFAKFTQVSASSIRKMLTIERVQVLQKTLALIDARLRRENAPARQEYLRQKRQEAEAMLNRARKLVAKGEVFVSEEAVL